MRQHLKVRLQKKYGGFVALYGVKQNTIHYKPSPEKISVGPVSLKAFVNALKRSKMMT